MKAKCICNDQDLRWPTDFSRIPERGERIKAINSPICFYVINLTHSINSDTNEPEIEIELGSLDNWATRY